MPELTLCGIILWSLLQLLEGAPHPWAWSSAIIISTIALLVRLDTGAISERNKWRGE
jgi:hypothetical protein